MGQRSTNGKEVRWLVCMLSSPEGDFQAVRACSAAPVSKLEPAKIHKGLFGSSSFKTQVVFLNLEKRAFSKLDLGPVQQLRFQNWSLPKCMCPVSKTPILPNLER